MVGVSLIRSWREFIVDGGSVIDKVIAGVYGHWWECH